MKNLIFNGDLCIIKSPSNLYYFTGYENADAVIVFTAQQSYYFTDARYFEEVEFLKDSYEIADIKDYRNFLSQGNFIVASVEKSLSIEDYNLLKDCGINEIRHVDDAINKLRAVKTEQEIKLIKSAQSITDCAFEKILSRIENGMTERDLASKLESILYECGAEDLAFKSIVAFGENTSKPHAHRSDKRLEKGMPITLDFGAKYSGYCSDMTRTVFFGAPSFRMKEVYNLVLEAQKIALDGIKTGMSGRECDALARDYFRQIGVDNYFIHSLGHSLGIDIHESPNFSQRSEDIFLEGMTVSVEPGLYFQGEFGVRIEDIIYFGETGIINLTKSSKNMIII